MNSRSITKRCLPFLFSLLVLFALELMTRGIVYLFDIQLDIVVIHPNLGQAELKKQIYVNDRFLLWKMKPDLNGQFVSPILTPPGLDPPVFQVVTNARGFAGNDFSDVKEDGTLRLVCLGNSSTFGWGVPPDSCYARLLEGILHERLQEEVEVINVGTPGYSSLQGLTLYKRQIAQLNPDLVTLSFGANDCFITSRGDAEIMLERAGMVGAIQEILSHSSLYRVLRYFIVSSRISKDVNTKRSSGRRRVNPGEFRAAMQDLISSSEESGTSVILVEIFPISNRWDPYREALRDVSHEHGVPQLDTGELFHDFLTDTEEHTKAEMAHMRATRERYGENILQNHPDIFLRLDRVHPSSLGHLLIAGKISDLVLTETEREDG